MLDRSATASPQAAAASVRAPDALECWNDSRAAYAREELQRRIYGRIPDLSALEVEAMETAENGSSAFKLEKWRLVLPARAARLTLELLVVTPRAAPLRVMLLAQTFQHRGAAIDAWVARLRGLPRATGLGERAREWILGRHIHAPPFHEMLAAGVGLVLFRPADIIPDHPQTSAPVLETLSGDVAPEARGGVLAHWAGLSSALRARAAERFKNVPVVAWGHSRHGKAALLAGAFDQGFAGVIAHQSGRFGAALTNGARGESIAQIARAYPHWFCLRFLKEPAGACSGIDQHHLLALVAPRPLLLGNAGSDFWADPAGSARAAQAASAAYMAIGAKGLGVPLAATPDYGADLVMFERPGWHGVNEHDWRHFLAFLKAKFAFACAATPGEAHS